jgi:hypothetical protein
MNDYLRLMNITFILRLIFIASVLQAMLVLQSCGSGCDGGFGETKYSVSYYIQIDSASKDSIKQISYAGGGKVFYPNSKTAQFYFTPSKKFTIMYITTFKQIDTLVFDNKLTFNYTVSDCYGDRLTLTTQDGWLVKHTFDTVYFKSYDHNNSQNYYSNSYDVTKILNVRLK